MEGFIVHSPCIVGGIVDKLYSDHKARYTQGGKDCTLGKDHNSQALKNTSVDTACRLGRDCTFEKSYMLGKDPCTVVEEHTREGMGYSSGKDHKSCSKGGYIRNSVAPPHKGLHRPRWVNNYSLYYSLG